MQFNWLTETHQSFKAYYPVDSSLEDRRRITLHIVLSLIGIVFLILFSTIALIQQNNPLALADIVVCIVLIGNLIDLRLRHHVRFNIRFGLGVISLLYIFLYVTGGTEQTAYVWYFTYPLIACYLLGSSQGVMATFLMLLPVLGVSVGNSFLPFITDYSLNLEFRFVGAYLVVGFFAYVFERHGENNRKELKSINDSLEKIIEERTAALTASNTQLKREIEIRIAAEKSARLSQESLTTIMDSIDATIYVTDRNTCKILFMNKALKDHLGSDLTHQYCYTSILKTSGPCRACVLGRNSEGAAADGAPTIWEGENAITGRWSINVERTFPWVNGQQAYLHIATDISHLKTLQDERAEMEAQLRRSQKMEALGMLAGGVAHDLNNVLSGLASYPEMLLWNLDPDSPLRKPLETIRRAGEKSAEIVQDMLTLARRGVSAMEVVNLNDIVSEYLQAPDFNKMTDNYPKVAVRSNLAADLLNFKGSPIHIRKTLMNLVSNAFEAQPAGGEIVIATYNHTVDLTQKGYERIHKGDFVVLEVTDRGHGISDEDKERIFEPFYTKKVMGRSGSGLGMAVVWGAVQDHHGIIDIESTVGQGTSFFIYLPVTRESLPASSAPRPVEEYTGSGQLVLVIDDDAVQREIASSILETLSYRVITAASGESALALIESECPDVLLLDMIMEPGMDGLETYRCVQKVRPGLKAVIASGFAETERVKAVQRLGAGAFVRKPYTIEAVGLALRKELNA